jgi:hypothetical protein
MLPAMVVFGVEAAKPPTQPPAKLIPIVQEDIRPHETGSAVQSLTAPQIVPPPEPRVMPPFPQYSGPWPVTPKEECQQLGDREEAQLCEEYPERETLLNSLVLGEPRTFHGAVLKNFNAVVLK